MRIERLFINRPYLYKAHMAQFDSLESLATLSTELLQFREHPLLQRLALGYDIAEGGANEKAKHPKGRYG
jgi:hypothetical protein